MMVKLIFAEIPHMNKNDLEKLVDIRVNEARILLEYKHYVGAYYMLGYAVECALKAIITKKVKEFDFPNKKLANDSHTHKLGDLIGVADLNQELSKRENNNDNFKENWAITKDWSEQARYELTKEEATVNNFFNAILCETSGILIWLKSWW
jgi:hypothetical protein